MKAELDCATVGPLLPIGLYLSLRPVGSMHISCLAARLKRPSTSARTAHHATGRLTDIGNESVPIGPTLNTALTRVRSILIMPHAA